MSNLKNILAIYQKEKTVILNEQVKRFDYKNGGWIEEKTVKSRTTSTVMAALSCGHSRAQRSGEYLNKSKRLACFTCDQVAWATLNLENGKPEDVEKLTEWLKEANEHAARDLTPADTISP